MATLVAMLPQVLLGPFAGAIVDRRSRRVVMIVADSFAALIAAWLAYLFWADAMRIWHVYIVVLARSLAGSFHWPAMQASTSLMVPKAQLSRVAGLNQALRGCIDIVAPPLGALLLSLLPLHGIMGIDVVTAIVAVSPLLFVHIPQPQQPAALAGTARRLSLWQDVRQGLSYVWHWRGLRMLMAGAALLNFLAIPAFSLTPILVSKYFGGGALQLGWINSAWGIGTVLGGLILSAWGGFRRRILTSVMGVIGMGLGMLLIGLTPPTAFWLALGGMFAVGMMAPFANGPLLVIMQATVAAEMQGRVFTLLSSVAGAMSPLGLAVAGPVADALGVRIWYIFGGTVGVLVGIAAFFIPAVTHLEDGQRPDAAVARPQAASEAQREGVGTSAVV